MPAGAQEATVTPKKRRTSAATATNSLSTLFDATNTSDLDFVMNYLKEETNLLPYLASMCRDGSLKRALAAKLLGNAPQALGRCLPERIKKFRNLLPRVLNAVWKEVMDEDSFETDASSFALETQEKLSEFAFRVNKDVLVPTSHKAARYEAPMVMVLVQRITDNGNPIRALTRQMIESHNFGYFTNLGSSNIRMFDGSEFTVDMTPEQYNRANDWVIENNCSLRASLSSARTGRSISLVIEAQRAGFGAVFEFNPMVPFEYPDLCNGFPEPPQTFDASPSASASSAGPAVSSPEALPDVFAGGAADTGAGPPLGEGHELPPLPEPPSALAPA